MSKAVDLATALEASPVKIGWIVPIAWGKLMDMEILTEILNGRSLVRTATHMVKDDRARTKELLNAVLDVVYRHLAAHPHTKRADLIAVFGYLLCSACTEVLQDVPLNKLRPPASA